MCEGRSLVSLVQYVGYHFILSSENKARYLFPQSLPPHTNLKMSTQFNPYNLLTSIFLLTASDTFHSLSNILFCSFNYHDNKNQKLSWNLFIPCTKATKEVEMTPEIESLFLSVHQKLWIFHSIGMSAFDDMLH